MSALGLSWRMLRRDWRAGELRVLALALIIAVASVTSVAFFTDRIRLALNLQAHELLGADLVVRSDHPLDDLAAPAGVRTARTVAFPTMVLAGDNSALASLEAVSDAYPLRGALRIADALFGPDRRARGGPPRGAVWMESRLMNALAVAPGEYVRIGDARLRVAAVLTNEPARAGGTLFNIAPRLLMNVADLDATGLVQPASRVRYRYLFAGETALIRAFRAAITARLHSGERVEGIEDARPEIRAALDRAERFLGLAALVSVLLAGVAVAVATRRYIVRHLDSCAMMRCLGASQRFISRLFVLEMLWLGLGAGVLGSALGYGAHFGLMAMLATLATVALPAPSAVPWFGGLAIALVTQLGFALPPLLHLQRVPALRVLRRDLGGLPLRSVSAYVAAIFAFAILMVWQTGDVRLSLTVLGGLLATLVVLGLVTLGLLRALASWTPHLALAWRLGVQALTRRRGGSVVQVLAFGLGIMVLLLLTLVRDDLLRDWRLGLPADAPNRFLINVQPEQVEPLRHMLKRRAGLEPEFYPMVRGRLTAIDGREVSPESYSDDRASRLARREFNLSWAATLPVDNHLTAGKWWPAGAQGRAVVSVEKGLAETLGIRLGDRLTFDVADSTVQVVVQSLREVQWDSFRVNFFVIAAPGVLDDFPASYITSLYLAPRDAGLLNAVVQRFPNVTVIDVAAIMAEVRGMIARVTQAVQYVFLFTLVAGVLVMLAAIHATLDERIRESVLLRTLGADRAQVRRGILVEFAGLGCLAGFVAAAAATVIAYVLADTVFHLDFSFDPRVWLTGVLLGTAGVGLAGWLGARFVLREPPLAVLRGNL